MSSENPKIIEKKESMEDNARKFIVQAIDPNFLKENNASSYELIVDWIATDEDSEKKLAYKKFENGDVQILLISKVTENGIRTSEKKTITEEEYKTLIGSTILHLQKRRYELKTAQNNISFSLKYDEFENGKLCMLEVDAANEDERNLFNPGEFPASLSEVTGDIRYYGYRVADMLI